jgi:predicted alpha/beta superfamily hydrolase
MFRSCIIALALAAAQTGAAPAAGPALSPATLDFAQQFDVTSKITGRTYRIYVSTPLSPPPKGGYPVLYVLDGNISFSIAHGQEILGGLSGGRPVLVVGVGYPNAAAAMTLRSRDLTPTQPADQDPGVDHIHPKPENYAGADAFHRFMMEELRPAIASFYPINTADQALMGYSLGGLFTLHVMFEHPSAYRSYIAQSPSIWWDGRVVLNEEREFVEAVRSGAAAPRILITSDAWEQSETSPELPPSGEARAKAIKEMWRFRMVENARELADRLKALPGRAGYEVRYAIFPDETHETGSPAATSRGVAFLQRPWP